MDDLSLCYESVRLLQNLNRTMQDAGGSILTMEQLRKMSVLELIQLLGPNHISFVWEPPCKVEMGRVNFDEPSV